jgi:hypothetical protein
MDTSTQPVHRRRTAGSTSTAQCPATLEAAATLEEFSKRLRHCGVGHARLPHRPRRFSRWVTTSPADPELALARIERHVAAARSARAGVPERRSLPPFDPLRQPVPRLDSGQRLPASHHAAVRVHIHGRIARIPGRGGRWSLPGVPVKGQARRAGRWMRNRRAGHREGRRVPVVGGGIGERGD